MRGFRQRQSRTTAKREVSLSLRDDHCTGMGVSARFWMYIVLIPFISKNVNQMLHMRKQTHRALSVIQNS